MKGEIVVKQSRDFQPFAVVIVVEQILQNYFLPTITCYDGTRNLVHHVNSF